MKWSSPIRTYLAMSLILFGFMALTQTHIFSMDVNVKPKEGVNLPRAQLTADDLSYEFQMHMLERQNEIDARNATRDFELIKRKMLNEDGSLRFDISAGEEEPNEDNPSPLKEKDASPLELEIGTDDNSIELDEEGNIMVNGKPIDNRRAGEFVFDFMQNPAIVTNSFRIWLPRLIFFMMPLTMFIGAIFIRGRSNAMLFDHIIHAAYIHSVAFFLLFVGMLGSYILPGSLISKWFFILMLIYLPLSLRRMFGRGWFKTILTSYGVGFIYMLILSIGLMVIMAKTLSDAAT